MPNRDFLILINEKDKQIGTEEKLETHKKGKPHRDLWSNTVCTHPKPNEPILKSAHRKLKQEMGFDCSLKKLFKFHYKTSFENGLIENEIDTVFIGKYNGEVNPNPEEVSDFIWISIQKKIKPLFFCLKNFNKTQKVFDRRIKKRYSCEQRRLHGLV